MMGTTDGKLAELARLTNRETMYPDCTVCLSHQSNDRRQTVISNGDADVNVSRQHREA